MNRVTSFTWRPRALPAFIFGFLCVLLLGAPRVAHAQNLDDNGSGTTYILAFPDTTANKLDSRFPNNKVKEGFSLFLYSAIGPNKVKIISGGGATNVVTLAAGKFLSYDVKTNPVVAVSNSIQYNTIRLEAEKPIIVYCFFAVKQSCEAWTPIPVELWGTEYNVAATPSGIVNDIGIAGETAIPFYAKPSPAEFLILSAYDNTKVVVTNYGRKFNGNPDYTFTLGENQVYQIQSWCDTNITATNQVDIAGVRIAADKPIGVISGHSRTLIRQDEGGLANNAYKNMLMEWVPPTEQHGTEFVYMPSWDSHRPGINSPSERVGEMVRMYGTDGTTPKDRTDGYYLQPGGGPKITFSVPRDTMNEFFFGEAQAAYFKTAKPSMAMMHSVAITKFNGSTPCFQGLPCLSYSAWAPYMVELTPREQWPSFAPYYAPTNPSNMQHYINVVCDTNDQKNIYTEQGTPFLFTRKIPGTSLIWGSQGVAQGQDHYLQGKNGARFAGFVYGTYTGGEEYRPGHTKKKGDDVSLLGGGGENDSADALHPCEYEEYNALSYGYPLAPQRRVLRPADSLKIDTVMECTALHVTIRALNPSPVGLRSISLDPTSVINAKLLPIDPARLSDIIGKTTAKVDIVPINPLKDAQATLVVKDRTGKVWYIYYTYQAERLDMDKDSVNFGEVTKGQSLSTTITYTNPLKRDVKISEMKLTSGLDGFTIVSTDPTLPTTLKPGQTLKVVVRVDPNIDNKLYQDSLKAVLECVKITIPLSAETVQPIITINDADFGVMVEGDPIKGKLIDLCNNGRGFISFKPDTSKDASPDVLTWLDKTFNVPQSTLDSLKSMKLGPNECVHFYVYFDPSKSGLGSFQTVARAWANTRTIRDLSKWTAVVTKPGPQITPYDWDQQWIVPAAVNCTQDKATSYESFIYAFNNGTADVDIQSIQLTGPDAPYFELVQEQAGEKIDPGMRIPGTKRISATEIDTAGMLANRLPQKVRFRPTEERSYSCNVVLTTTADPTHPISTFLRGIGIESHAQITGQTYGPSLFVSAGALVDASKTITITSSPATVTENRRDLHVTNVRITGPDANDFVITTAPLAFTMKPNEQKLINVEFHPQTSGKKYAFIQVDGDQSLCDVVIDSLYGYTFTVGLETEGFDFGTNLTCNRPVGNVTVKNTGSEPITVNNVKLVDSTDAFEIVVEQLPFLLAPGEVKTIPATFHSPNNRTGSFGATVEFEAVDKDGKVVNVPSASLKGQMRILTVNAHINTDYRAYPGNSLTIPVTLDDNADQAQVTTLFISIRYDNRVLRMSNGSADSAAMAKLLKGTILEGWTVRIVEADHPEGEYLAIFTAPQGKFLKGSGNLLNLNFLTYLGAIDSSKLNLSILQVGDQQCVKVNSKPGLVRIDSVCGLNLRLIESTGFNYKLGQNSPNPFNPTTDITFSLGLDGLTTLEIYDAGGKQVGTLLNGYMKSGTYTIPWDAKNQASGLYYYRLQSGDWTQTNTMILRK